MRKAIAAYLSEHNITYTAMGGGQMKNEVKRGVPQDSVLGPLLWNLIYDSVLKVNRPSGATIVGHADDTMVMKTGWTWREAKRCTETGTVCVIRAIKS